MASPTKLSPKKAKSEAAITAASPMRLRSSPTKLRSPKKTFRSPNKNPTVRFHDEEEAIEAAQDDEHDVAPSKLFDPKKQVIVVPTLSDVLAMASHALGCGWPTCPPWRTTLQTTKGLVPICTVLIQNLRACILVAVISMVLSIGLGVASGSTPIAGLRAAIWGGIICGLLGSSPFNVIGPAGALSSQLSSYSHEFGPDVLPWISIFSGIICFVLVGCGLQKYVLFMPKSVFEGFTISVAFTIGLKQINYAFGLKGLPVHETFPENVWESIKNLDKAQGGSMGLFFPEAFLLYFLMRYIPKIPWLVIIPISTILLGFAYDGDPNHGLPTLKTRFGQLPNTVVMFPSPAGLADAEFGGIVMASASVAFVSVLETLISAKIAEFRAPDNALGPFSETREIAALTVAQVVTGVFGGLPPTGVFVRTAANQANGATHTVAQFMNAVLVLLITLVTMPAFSFLPLASIAALLVVSSIRMIPFHFLFDLWKNTKKHFFLCILTAIVCTCYEASIGILAGTLIAYLMNAMESSNAPGTIRVETWVPPGKDGTVCIISLSGAVNFANADAVVLRSAKEVESKCPLLGVHHAVIDLTYMTEADFDGAEAVERLAVLVGRRIDPKDGIQRVYVSGPSPSVMAKLMASRWFQKANAEGRVSFSCEEAVESMTEEIRIHMQAEAQEESEAVPEMKAADDGERKQEAAQANQPSGSVGCLWPSWFSRSLL